MYIVNMNSMRRYLYDFSSSIIFILNYWLCNHIICRSCVILFPYGREHKEKGANISWFNLAGAMLFFSITTGTSVGNSQAWWFVTPIFRFPAIHLYIAHNQSHTSFHSSPAGITLYCAQVFYAWCEERARKHWTSYHFGLLVVHLSDSGRLYTLTSPFLFSKI